MEGRRILTMQITKGKIAKAQKTVFYGPEGIGKSTFAANFPDPLFIDTEGSTNNMEVARLNKPTSWTMLKQQIDFVKQNRPCQTLVIDTIDWAERLAIEHICSKAGKQSITDFGYGIGFNQLEEEFGRFLNLLSDLCDIGINVLLTAHAKITKFEQPDEMGAYDRWELKLGNKTTAKTAALTKEWADMVLFANYKTFSVAADAQGKRHKGQGGKRVIYTTHHPAWDAKNRFGLPDEIDLDYQQISAIFQTNTAETTPTVPQENQHEEVQPASQPVPPKEQVKEPISSSMNIPPALADLMREGNVTVEEIQQVVGQKGYYTPDTPIENYDPGFVQGVLVGAWQQVFNQIVSARK